MSQFNSLNIFGYNVLSLDQDEAVHHINGMLGSEGSHAVFFMNSNLLSCCGKIISQQEVDANSVTFFNDGVGLDIISMISNGETFKENLNGTDFLPFLFDTLESDISYFLLGGKSVANMVCEKYMEIYPRHNCLGALDGFYDNERDVIRAINACQPDVLLVGMGNPRQEKFILDNLHEMNVKVAIGVGAFFDFESGKVSRAPLLVRKIRAEWFWRFILEPKRMFYRYFIAAPLLIFKAIHCRFFENK